MPGLQQRLSDALLKAVELKAQSQGGQASDSTVIDPSNDRIGSVISLPRPRASKRRS